MKRFILAVICSILLIGLACGYEDVTSISGNREPCCAEIVNPEIAKPLSCPKIIGNELFVCPQPCANECTSDFDCEENKVCCCRCGNKCLDGVEPSPGGWPAP